MSNIQKKADNLPSIEDFSKKSGELTFSGQIISKQLNLTISERNYLESINYKPISEIPVNNLIDLIFVVVSNNLRALGSKMKSDDIVLLVNDFMYELQNDFKQLTIKEFEIIVKNGIRGKYDENTIGLSIVNFNRWYSIYSQRKFKLNTEIQNKLNRSRTLIESPEKDVTKKDVINLGLKIFTDAEFNFNSKQKPPKNYKAFVDYWLDNGMVTSANYLYDQLIKFKLIAPAKLEDQLYIDPSEKNNGSEFFSLSEIRSKTAIDEAKRKIVAMYFLNYDKKHGSGKK
jgi:hypothetical protein